MNERPPGAARADANSNARDFNARAVINHGTVNWNSGYIRSGNGGSFTNAAGATFNDFNAPSYPINNPFGVSRLCAEPLRHGAEVATGADQDLGRDRLVEGPA